MAWLIGVSSFIVFLFFQVQGIFTGDSGDLVTAAIVHGVPHPPGYPLYTLLGFLLSQLPFFTLTWRVTLLSSLAHALTIGVVFLLVSRLTKNKIAGLFSSLILLGNYLFFLYSVTPEVFALLDLFFVVLLYQLYVYQSSRTRTRLLLLSFTFGLSLTHHHLILFAVPALVFGILSAKLPKGFGIKASFQCIGLFMTGLFAYLYAPIVAFGNPIINWDKPTTWARFFQLITREDYGSFLSGGTIGHTFTERFISIRAYITFVLLDFTLIGVALSVIGLWALWKKERNLTIVIVLLLVLFGPFFFFYASFPIVSRFTLGTYERFLLPSYILLTILVGVGFDTLQKLVTRLIETRVAYTNIVTMLFSCIIFFYPVTMLSMTLYRSIGLSTDKTAENLGRDVLESLPNGAILLLSQDTMLFTTQFVRYGLRVREDTSVLHTSLLAAPFYQEVLRAQFPALVLESDASYSALEALVRNNIQKRRIFSNTTLSIGSGWYYVPHGLVYEIVSEQNLPPIASLRIKNDAIFQAFHNPLSGILSRYKHLMLSDVLDVYAWAHINYGKTLIKATVYDDAIVQFEQAANLEGDSSKVDAYTYLGVTYATVSRCTDALEALNKAKEASFVPKPELKLYESLTYRDCIKDQVKANELRSVYEKLKLKAETPLQSL